MLTDDDLIRELEAGFRDESQGLTYAGRVPAPRRAVATWTAVPAAAAAAALIVLPQLGGGGTSTATPAPPQATQTVPEDVHGSFGAGPSAPTANGHVRMVTTSFEFAGRTFRVQRPANQAPRYVVCRIGAAAPPADATPVPNPFDIEKAWSGQDPQTGTLCGLDPGLAVLPRPVRRDVQPELHRAGAGHHAPDPPGPAVGPCPDIR